MKNFIFLLSICSTLIFTSCSEDTLVYTMNDLDAAKSTWYSLDAQEYSYVLRQKSNTTPYLITIKDNRVESVKDADTKRHIKDRYGEKFVTTLNQQTSYPQQFTMEWFLGLAEGLELNEADYEAHFSQEFGYPTEIHMFFENTDNQKFFDYYEISDFDLKE